MNDKATPVYTVQVCIDCADPHDLADWWAEALGWLVEPQDESFIRSMIEQGFAAENETTRHKGELVWAMAAAIRHPDGPSVAPRILFQHVPEPKTIKNRVHLDLRTERDPSVDEVRRLRALGAGESGSGQEGPHHWVTLTDPEGNEFCISVPVTTG